MRIISECPNCRTTGKYEDIRPVIFSEELLTVPENGANVIFEPCGICFQPTAASMEVIRRWGFTAHYNFGVDFYYAPESGVKRENPRS